MDVLSLQSILDGFNAPLNEEQSWAVCFQCAVYLEQSREVSQGRECFCGIQSVLLSKDGTVSNAVSASTGVYSEHDALFQVVQSLGVCIFQALDYGLSENEERRLGLALQGLLERMTDSDRDEDDEGIEHDDHHLMTLHDVLQCCEQRLQPPLEAASYYKAVCHALVTEAIELSTFLEKISTNNQTLRSSCDQESPDDDRLLELNRADWARLWMQVMRDLRLGVQLKEVHRVSADRVCYELTPYEMLMEDIRSRRYTLNKVMVNGDIPPATKHDAHAIILSFIRSRPPLHPAGRRQLRDAPETRFNPREKLMEAIRLAPRVLKPTPGRIVETSRTRLDSNEPTPEMSRKVIKPDLTLFSNSFEEEEFEDTDDDDVFDEKNKVTPSPIAPFTPLSPKSPPGEGPWQQTAASSEFAAKENKSSERRHSITVCESPCSQPSSAIKNGAANPFENFPGILASDFSCLPNTLQSSLECLSLTIEEVMHIRSVLTKAELECLLVDPELHGLVSKGKVCFTCKRTRFSIFGQWSTKCKFCQRYVCSTCVSKMHIPTEHFEHIPVYTLSPGPLSPQDDTDYFLTQTKTGSAPSSPAANQKAFSSHSSPDQPITAEKPRGSHGNIPTMATNHITATENPRRAPFLRSKTLARPQALLQKQGSIDGPLMNICCDCKAMIVNIIRASRLSLATAPDVHKTAAEIPSRKADRNFHLDLKPVYKGFRK